MSLILDNLLSQLGPVEKDHRAKRSAERAKETSGTSEKCSPYCMKPNHDGHSTGDLVFYRYYHLFSSSPLILKIRFVFMKNAPYSIKNLGHIKGYVLGLFIFEKGNRFFH